MKWIYDGQYYEFCCVVYLAFKRKSKYLINLLLISLFHEVRKAYL